MFTELQRRMAQLRAMGLYPDPTAPDTTAGPLGGDALGPRARPVFGATLPPGLPLPPLGTPPSSQVFGALGRMPTERPIFGQLGVMPELPPQPRFRSPGPQAMLTGPAGLAPTSVPRRGSGAFFSQGGATVEAHPAALLAGGEGTDGLYGGAGSDRLEKQFVASRKGEGSAPSLPEGQGATAYLAENLLRSEQVRLDYDQAASRFGLYNNPARDILKEKMRKRSPAPERVFIEMVRGRGTGPREGSHGGAARTNPKWSRAARIMGKFGRGSAVVSTGLGAFEIATARDKARAASGVGGSAAGGAGGGIAGAELGALIGTAVAPGQERSSARSWAGRWVRQGEASSDRRPEQAYMIALGGAECGSASMTTRWWSKGSEKPSHASARSI